MYGPAYYPRLMVSRMSRSARQSIGSGVKVGPEEKFPIALVLGQWIALVDKAEANPDLTGAHLRFQPFS